jgi:hypothetical protein
MEDLSRIKKDLETFFKHRNKIQNKDINSYSSLNNLYDVVEPLEDDKEEVSKRQTTKALKSKEADVIIDSPNFKVIVPKTEKASCLYGAGTKWCTAGKGDNAFAQYHSQGPLYIIIAGDKKFQLHYESDSFMDARDQAVSKKDIEYLSKFPQYTIFLNMLIDKHYSKYLTRS